MENTQLQASCQARDSFWASIGQLSPDVLAPIINPAFAGGPMWPSLRQSFGVVTLNDKSIILFSDGLSDPFQDVKGPAVNGFELEFYIHTVGSIETICPSWQTSLLNQISQLSASNGSIRGQLDKYNYLTTELYVENIPKQFINEKGRVGVILDVPSKIIPEKIKLPLSDVKLVSAILLTLKELEYVVREGAEGRAQLAKKLINSTGTLTSLERISLV